MHTVLEWWARENPHGLALRFLEDGETLEQTATFAELWELAKRCSTGLQTLGLSGKPLLLALSPGIEFVAALFGCWHAAAIPVPVYPPRGTRHKKRFEAVAIDSGATHAILTSGGNAPPPGIEILDFGSLISQHPGFSEANGAGPISLIQYTSGSTAMPKGVGISHANLRAHFRSLSCFANLEISSALSWLPPYHDMGLVLKILYAIEAGIPLTFFSPDQFIQRPIRWLQAISKYQAEMSGAPNFAFEACVRAVSDQQQQSLDLTSWKAAPCGAERIRPETLKRFAAKFTRCGFREEAFLPGYGLAETTLIVTAGKPGAPPLVTRHPTAGTVVSCGPALDGNQVRITDPETGGSLDDWEIGEIRVKGPVVSEGYWRQSHGSSETFQDGELKTGDLGFLADGELHVTGRIKDLIILDGLNFAPEDIESIILENHPELPAAAAFPVEENDREVLGIALETPRLTDKEADCLCESVRQMLVDNLGISPSRIHLLRNGLLPRTTSGKIQRHACAPYLTERSQPHWLESRSPSPDIDHQQGLETLLTIAGEITGRKNLIPEDDVVSLGISSLDATRMAARIRARMGVHLSVRELFAARGFRQLAASLPSSNRANPSAPGTATPDPEKPTILSHAQERMWFLHQFDPSSAAYHVFGAAELLGPLDLGRLRTAYRQVVLRHEMLNSRHGSSDGRPDLRFVSNQPIAFEETTVTREEEIIHRLQEFAKRPFDLSNDIPIRALLVTTKPGRHVLGISAHHIVADGWSIRIMATELAEIYAGKPGHPPAPSYVEYSRAHRKWIDNGGAKSQIDYWKKNLKGHSGVSILPTDFPRPAKPSSSGGFHYQKLSESIVDGVALLAKKHRTTPFTIHLSLLFLLLRQHGGGDDQVIAIPVANRNHDETSGLVGTLVNTLPFRLKLDALESFAELLNRAGAEVFEMLENQDAPFERIIDAVRPERTNQHAPLAQVMFDHQELPLEQLWPDDIVCRPYQAHRGAAQFDLSLFLTSYGNQQQIGIEYRKDLFLDSTIESMLERYLELLKRVCESPQKTVREISKVSPADLAILDSFSHGPDRPAYLGVTTLEIILDRASRHPDRPAIHSMGTVLTYGQLDEISSRIASYLKSRGVRENMRIAILLGRDYLLPASIIALWKLGAAYVPLDPANPPERLRLILSDQSPVSVLAAGSLASLIPAEFPVIEPDAFTAEPLSDFQFAGARPKSPAYLIYTSGSTGTPKGTSIPHQALANFLLSMAESPGFTEADRLLAVTTISFDISCLEIFLPLITGGSVEIASQEQARDGAALMDAIHKSRPTVMQATPATWRMLIEAGWRGFPDLKILCGGEALDLPLAGKLMTMGCQLWNLYGPTETTVWSSCWRVPEFPEYIRIGAPIANTGLHVLSEDGAILPPGAIGELWISGDGLADGYWGNPDLTEERFRKISDQNGCSIRAYQTGDLARWHSDGTLECLGRSDGQVKIRGFRVELGEIESILNAHPEVSLAKVALRECSSLDDRLVAWIKPFAAENLNPESIRAYLADRLPSYMIPADFSLVSEFPLTSSGKVDVNQLPTPEVTSRVMIEMMTPTERAMTEIWCELLGRGSVAPHDNWFHLGGHSLLALRLFSRIHQRFGCKLPLSAILEHPSPASLAAQVELHIQSRET